MIREADLTKYGKAIWFDGKMVDPKEATVSVMSHAVHYGTGFFEGIRAYETDQGAAIFRLDEHVARLYRTIKMYYVDIPYDFDTIRQAIIDTVKINEFKSCYIRPSIFLGTGWNALVPSDDILVHTAISCWPLGSPSDHPTPIKAKVASYRRLSSSQCPMQAKAASNYMNSLLLKFEAKQNGFDEAIALDMQGQVSEASASNIFFVWGNEIHTPSLASSVFNGITRLSVMEFARDLGYTVIERTIARDDLYTADEIFLTGTAAEVQSIGSVDNIPVGNGNYPVGTALIQKFKEVSSGKSEKYNHWLTYVNS